MVFLHQCDVASSLGKLPLDTRWVNLLSPLSILPSGFQRLEKQIRATSNACKNDSPSLTFRPLTVATNVQVYDGITPELSRIASRFENPQGLMRVAGGELRAALQDHFRARNQSIYRQIAQATQLASVTRTEAEVRVGGGQGLILLHKINGGVVRAKEAGALSIPLTPEAKRVGYARHFPRPLTMINRPNKPPLLVEIKRWTGRNAAWVIHYVLTKSVYHRPDPQALPDRAAVESRILARVRAWADAVLPPS